MLTKRQQRILQQILSKPGIRGKEIADLFKISARTIRTEISNINKSENCLLITSSVKTGYVIHEDYQDLAYQLVSQDLEVEDSPENRMYRIIGTILFDEECTLFDLSDCLMLSMSATKKEVNRTLQVLQQVYNCTLFNIKKEVCILCLDENEIRDVLLRMVKDALFQQENQSQTILQLLLDDSYILQETEYVKQEMMSILHRFDIKLTDMDFMVLLYGIQICRARNSMGFALESSIEDVEEMIQTICLSLSYLQNEDVSFLSRLYHTFKIAKTNLKSEISEFSNIVFNEFCQEIFDKYSIDLNESRELAQNMLIHIEYMNRRVLSGYELSNPLLDEVKHKYPFSFEISMMIVPIIFKYKRIYVKEDEVSYLSIYVEHFLENINTRIKTIVVTSQRHNVKNMLLQWLEQYFKNQLEVVRVMSRFSMNMMDFSHIELIVSMNDCLPVEGVETYMISGLPDLEDVAKLDRLIHRIKMNKRVIHLLSEFIPENNVHIYNEAISLENCLCDVSKKLKEKQCIDDATSFCEDLILREVNYPTHLANKMMMPHPLFTFAKKTSIEVILLKKPILHQNIETQLLFVLALEKQTDEKLEVLFEFLHQASNHKTYVDQLLTCTSNHEFIEHLLNLKLIEE